MISMVTIRPPERRIDRGKLPEAANLGMTLIFQNGEPNNRPHHQHYWSPRILPP